MRTTQIIEDMSRACILDLEGSCDAQLTVSEFCNNNCFQLSIQIDPDKVLYRR